MVRKIQLLLLIVTFSAGESHAQEKVTYSVVADANDFFVHVKGVFIDGDMWIQNMNIGSSIAVDVGLNKRMKLSGSGYWAHFYDGGIWSDRTNGTDKVMPVKTMGPTLFWDIGFMYNYKVNKVKTKIPLHVSSSQEKFLGQVISVTNKSIYVPGTMQSSRALTARIENFSTLINLDKNSSKAEFQMLDNGEYIPYKSVPMIASGTPGGGGAYFHTQMNATSAYFGWRSTIGENHMIVKTSKGKLKNFGRTSYFFEYAPFSVVQFGDIVSHMLDGKVWEIKSDKTIGRGWRARFDVQMSQKRTTLFSQVTIGQRPGYRRLFFNVKWGYMLFVDLTAVPNGC